MLHLPCLLTAIILLLTQIAAAQVKPSEDKILNYRIIGVSPPPDSTADSYTLEVAQGRFWSADSFKKAIIATIKSNTNKIIAEVPAFGQQYTWRVVYHRQKNVSKRSPLYHFSTGADTNATRFRITKEADNFKDACVFLDRNKTLYDMNGRPLWYLPAIEGRQHLPSDLKMTSQGTITFISDNAYEVNYDGDILWKAPIPVTNGPTGENAHHEFTKLSNGHYMTLGNELVAIPADTSDASGGSGLLQKQERTIRFGTIVEYNSDGKIVWSWKSSKYFIANGIINHPGFINKPSPHMNAFYFDEQQSIIYLSCKIYNTVLKIKYPEGDVINSYGEAPFKGSSQTGNHLFCGQHGVQQNKQGYILLYNNNDCSEGGSQVKILKEPQSPRDDLKIIWEYECSSDATLNTNFNSGGNVIELPDNNYLVCMGGNYSKTFIVNEQKKILWSGLPEMMTDTGWSNNYVYRASIIENRTKLADLIWHDTNVPTNTSAINSARITP